MRVVSRSIPPLLPPPVFMPVYPNLYLYPPLNLSLPPARAKSKFATRARAYRGFKGEREHGSSSYTATLDVRIFGWEERVGKSFSTRHITGPVCTAVRGGPRGTWSCSVRYMYIMRVCCSDFAGAWRRVRWGSGNWIWFINALTVGIWEVRDWLKKKKKDWDIFMSKTID